MDWDYLYPHGLNEHKQYKRNQLVARNEEGVACCLKCKAPRYIEVVRGQSTYLQPRGVWYDLRAPEILRRAFRRKDSPLHEEFLEDNSRNAFLQSVYGQRLMEATNGQVGDPANIQLELAADGVTVYKFKHHVTTVIVMRFRNVPPDRRGQNANVEIIVLVPGPEEPPNVSLFLQGVAKWVKESQQPGGAITLSRPATEEEVSEQDPTGVLAAIAAAEAAKAETTIAEQAVADAEAARVAAEQEGSSQAAAAAADRVEAAVAVAQQALAREQAAAAQATQALVATTYQDSAAAAAAAGETGTTTAAPHLGARQSPMPKVV